ncbi:MAG: 2Fe-2S iron-sulfur cluster-binding protein [Dehalococcoidia bacterium]|nr:2Fe-2S iron-sulfur cluster-binding protein [Dehalococcoidia bacterium]
MSKLTIDGKTVEAAEGTTILAAANKSGVDIPTLCYNEELSPAGACRLCVVEVVNGQACALMTACDNPVSEGMTIDTNSPRALDARRLATEVLLAQRPTSKKLQDIARRLGLDEPRFTLPQQECILCRQCTRTCQEVVGVGAVSFIMRGLGREVEPRVIFDAERCIACGSCAYICPTEAIKLTDAGGKRTLMTPSGKMEFCLKACGHCGAYFAPEKQLVYMARQSGLPQEKFDLCLNCRD